MCLQYLQKWGRAGPVGVSKSWEYDIEKVVAGARQSRAEQGAGRRG
jgi:hypothetical protein